MIDINNCVKYLKTVGSRREVYLNELGIYTVKDLIYYLPKNVEDRRNVFLLEETQFVPLKKVSIVGKILSYEILYTKNNFGIFKSSIKTEMRTFPIINLIWFKKVSYKYDVFATLKKNIGKQYINKYIIAYGRVGEKIKRIPEIVVEDYELINDLNEKTIHTKRLVPIYSLSTKITQQWFRELMFDTLNKISLTEYLPWQVIEKENLLDLNTAIKNVHFPESWQLYAESRKRLMFDKFLFLQLKIQKLKRDIIQKNKVGKYELKGYLLTPFKNKMKSLIPNFDFTKAQKKVINELFNDMMSKVAMNRILLGDVGSGKTLVAVSCMLLAIENGYQVAFMAPTEILAQQHYFNLETYFQDLKNPFTGKKIRVALYIGKTLKTEKEKILNELSNGEIDLIIGTHSLLEEKVSFNNLSLVVIDEQHRFGVLQRKKLYEKTFLPDILIMTATPIPRSLAMTLYGELDISILDQMPPGRKQIKTIFYNNETEALKFVYEKLVEGEKVYIVYPTIEDNKLELKSLIQEYHKLSSGIFKDYKCGLIHGKMSSIDKENQMLKFKNGEYKILFSTTVIEVGIDVCDATVMLINHAERFGLSTLHQLRGRVGRSDRQSYCILLGNLTTEESQQRIQIMLETNDGFRIAEKDLEIRGPGEIFGIIQHGKNEIDYSDVIKYSDILMKARHYAKSIILEKKFFIKQIEDLVSSSEIKNNLGNIG